MPTVPEHFYFDNLDKLSQYFLVRSQPKKQVHQPEKLRQVKTQLHAIAYPPQNY